MKFWNKSKTQSEDYRPVNDSTGTVSRPEAFEEKLEQIHFQARPVFREDLKARLMQSLSEESLTGVPAAKPGRATVLKISLERHLPAPARLGLGGLVLAALLVLLVSVLSVGTFSQDKTASATVVAGGATKVTPGASSPASASYPSGTTDATQAQLRNFFDPAEAAKAMGFSVSLPAYLPAGYKLDYASYNKPTTMASGSAPLDFSGYLLRYTGTTTQAANLPGLEIAQWQVPTTLTIAGPATVVQAVNGVNQPITGSQAFKVETVAGVPGYLIEGGQWRIQLASAQAIPITGTIVSVTPGSMPVVPGKAGEAGSNSAIAVPALSVSGPISATTTSGEPSISFGQVFTTGQAGQTTLTNSGGFVIQFNTADTQQNVKTLIWQQNSVFTIVSSPDGLSDAVLKQIAESLKPSA